MPGTMLDLPTALRDYALRVWVAPDWRSNGHSYPLIHPFGGVLHHTAGYSLRAVYGEPDARPDVPQPRANIWTPRPGTQPYDVAVICAGRAWHAGAGRRQVYDEMRAGRISARTSDASVRFGPDSDNVDPGWTSLGTVGNEVEWAAGEFPDEQLDVVARTMRAAVDVFDWPGVGSWAHHRQCTARKPDMAYRGDIWSRAASITRGDDMSAEDVKAINAHTDSAISALRGQMEANLGAAAVNNPRAWLNAGIAARLGANERAALAPLLDDEAKLTAAVGKIPAGVSLDDVRAALRVVLAEGLPAGPA